MSFVKKVLTSFPVPSKVAMPAVGLDISDHSMKFLELIPTRDGFRVGRFATDEIPEGVIVGGTIARRDALVELLSQFRQKHDLSFVRASLPEEPGYIFTTQVPDVDPDEVRSLLKFKLEEHVPIAPNDAVIDYDVVPLEASGAVATDQHVVAVSVFPEALAQDYADLLHTAGLTPVSLEIEAQAIARAAIPKDDTGTCMVVDIGRMRSGITVATNGIVRFTTTIESGGDSLSTIIKQLMPQATEEELLRIRNEEGLAHTEVPQIKEATEKFAEVLRSNIERYYFYWQTHKDSKEGPGAQMPVLEDQTIKKIVLSGGYANLGGLSEYLSRELRVKTVRANAWANVCSLESYIPPITYRESLGYATAVGLALHRDVF
jgi:type IV pilus assembly protein PilM